MLIRNEFYVGRRFYTDSHLAVWFIEEDELKIFNADHQLLCVMSSAEIDAVVPEIECAMAESAAVELDAAEGDQTDAHPDVIKMPVRIEFDQESRDDSGDGFIRAA